MAENKGGAADPERGDGASDGSAGRGARSGFRAAFGPAMHRSEPGSALEPSAERGITDLPFDGADPLEPSAILPAPRGSAARRDPARRDAPRDAARFDRGDAVPAGFAGRAPGLGAGPAPGTAHGMRAGWYPCPSGAAQLRYFDGADWTDETRPDLVAWVHGRRILDMPGVFAYGRSRAAESGPGRRQALTNRQWIRLRNSLIAIPVVIVVLSVVVGYPASVLGLPATPVRYALYAIGVAGCAWAGDWITAGRQLNDRYLARYTGSRRPAAARPAAPGDLWAELREAGFDDAARRLDEEVDEGQLTDVDYVRVARVVRQSARSGSGADPARAAAAERLRPVAEAIEEHGGAAFVHPSLQRDLPVPRLVQHDLITGQARLGAAVDTPRNPTGYQNRWFALDTEVLRTSMLVIGPAGAGKTRSFARPVIEMLGLQTLVGLASVVVIDPSGSAFGPAVLPGFFDVDIDPAASAAPGGPGAGQPKNWGFDLFGGAATPDEAADRLAGALLPPDTVRRDPTADSAARNTLYRIIGAFHEREGRYPMLRELIDACAAAAAADPAGGVPLLNERLRLLDRPALIQLFDGRPRRFSMRQINKPTRVRIALPEGSSPQAASILARLAIAQFVQVVAAPDADRGVFKGLIVDEAGRFVDEYVVQGLQRARAANAGIMLLAQSMSQFPEHLRSAVFTGTGCKAVFAGVEPADARYFAEYWGTVWAAQTTVTTGSGSARTTGESNRPGDKRRDKPVLQALTGNTSVESYRSVATRAVERPVWSVSEIINDVPTGCALVSLSTADGLRTPPVLVNLRG